MVHALAFQTEVEGRTARDYRDTLLGRLDAFLGAKDLIAQSGKVKVSLSAIVDDALHAANSRQIIVEPSPSVQLGHAHVRPVRMMLHELTTNSLKYGALSCPSGVVHLEWSALKRDEDERLQIDWREESGPVVSPPDHRGFGMALIESSAKNCGGEVKFQFDPAGVYAQIVIPKG